MIVAGGLEALRSVLEGAEGCVQDYEGGAAVLGEEQKSIENMLALLFEKVGWDDVITFERDGPVLRDVAGSDGDDSG